MKGYRKLRNIILDQLEGLSPSLTYHGLHHTLDVLNICNKYIKLYGLSKHDASLLRIAALAHDIGFLDNHHEHELLGANKIQRIMEDMDFAHEDVMKVRGMILATKPDAPPYNFLEEIIIDADLDYLGRRDFNSISESLYQEFLHLGIVKNFDGWMKLQIAFLDNHKYYTKWAVEHRRPKKQKWITMLKEKYPEHLYLSNMKR